MRIQLIFIVICLGSIHSQEVSAPDEEDVQTKGVPRVLFSELNDEPQAQSANLDEALTVSPIVDALGGEINVGAESKIDLGLFSDHPGSDINLVDVSKNGSTISRGYIETAEKPENVDILHSPASMSLNGVEQLIYTTTTISSPVASAEVESPALMVDHAEPMEPLEPLAPVQGTRNPNEVIQVSPVHRPVIAPNREIISTKITTHTVFKSLPIPQNEPRTAAVHVHVTETVSMPGISTQMGLITETPIAASPNPIADTPLEAVSRIVELPIDPSLSHPIDTGPHPQIHDIPVPFPQINFATSEIIEAQIEKSIKDKVERYLKEKLGTHFEDVQTPAIVPIDPALQTPTPSSAEDVGSPSQVVITVPFSSPTITQVPFPQSPSSDTDLPESLQPNFVHLKEMLERELSSGFEDINLDRLRNALNSVINIEQEIIQSAALKADPAPTLTPQYDQEDHETYIPKEVVDEVQNEVNVLADIVRQLKDVKAQGLTDKDNKELRKAKYHLERLKDIPEDVWSIIYAKDKRQSIDDLLHAPYLRKIALDVTNFNDSATSERQNPNNSNGSSNSLSTPTNTADDEPAKDWEETLEKDLHDFESLNLDDDDDDDYDDDGGNDIDDVTKSKSSNFVSSFKPSPSNTTKDSKLLDGSNKVQFEFDRKKQKIGLRKERNPARVQKADSEDEPISEDEPKVEGGEEFEDDGEDLDPISSGEKDGSSVDYRKSPSQHLKQHSSSNSAGNVNDNNSTKPLSSSRTTSVSETKSSPNKRPSAPATSQSLLEKFKQNPSLLFSGSGASHEKDQNSFDFTRSGSSGKFDLCHDSILLILVGISAALSGIGYL